MSAHYEIETEIETEISDDYQLTVQLPKDMPSGHAKVAIAMTIDYETNQEASQKPKSDRNKRKAKMAEFLTNLSNKPTIGLTQAQIRAYLDEERQSWDD